jgi:protein tyrosine/serine phosphatase
VRTRHLDLEGCFNARDLGDLTAGAGRKTRRGAVVRSDALDGLTAKGWTALVEHGVRTIIDLRNDDERRKDVTPRPSSLTTLHLPHDNAEDGDFWEPINADWRCGTPVYYAAHLARFPERTHRVLSAIVEASPGGVLFHCAAGRDRTGLIAMCLLSIAGVSREEIVADYLLSYDRLRAAYARRGEPDQEPLIADFLRSQGMTPRDAVASALDAVTSFGIPRDRADRLRTRLLA